MGRLTPPGALRTPAVSLVVMRKRSDFLAAARARRIPAGSFLLQARQRDGAAEIRVGFTCSKKVGNAVIRNRAKRRLRELARHVLPLSGQPGWDYVLIGRATHTVERPFFAMMDDLRTALSRVHT